MGHWLKLCQDAILPAVSDIFQTYAGEDFVLTVSETF